MKIRIIFFFLEIFLFTDDKKIIQIILRVTFSINILI